MVGCDLSDYVLEIEHCKNCKAHMWSTKHDEYKYVQYCDQVADAVRDEYESKLQIRVNPGPHSRYRDAKITIDTHVCGGYFICRKDEEKVRTQYPRIGAFEISIVSTTTNDVKHLFSKLSCGRWPNHKQVLDQLRRVEDGSFAEYMMDLEARQASAKKRPKGRSRFDRSPRDATSASPHSSPVQQTRQVSPRMPSQQTTRASTSGGDGDKTRRIDNESKASERAESAEPKAGRRPAPAPKAKAIATCTPCTPPLTIPADDDLTTTLQTCLAAITKKDISELRAFNKPPQAVLTVLAGVMVSLGEKQDWDTSRQMLTEPSFLQRLTKYDKDNIPPARLRKLGAFLQKEEFQNNNESVSKASKATRAFCAWVKALHAYGASVRGKQQEERQAKAAAGAPATKEEAADDTAPDPVKNEEEIILSDNVAEDDPPPAPVVAPAFEFKTVQDFENQLTAIEQTASELKRPPSATDEETGSVLDRLRKNSRSAADEHHAEFLRRAFENDPVPAETAPAPRPARDESPDAYDGGFEDTSMMEPEGQTSPETPGSTGKYDGGFEDTEGPGSPVSAPSPVSPASPPESPVSPDEFIDATAPETADTAEEHELIAAEGTELGRPGSKSGARSRGTDQAFDGGDSRGEIGDGMEPDGMSMDSGDGRPQSVTAAERAQIAAARANQEPLGASRPISTAGGERPGKRPQSDADRARSGTNSDSLGATMATKPEPEDLFPPPPGGIPGVAPSSRSRSEYSRESFEDADRDGQPSGSPRTGSAPQAGPSEFDGFEMARGIYTPSNETDSEDGRPPARPPFKDGSESPAPQPPVSPSPSPSVREYEDGDNDFEADSANGGNEDATGNNGSSLRSEDTELQETAPETKPESEASYQEDNFEIPDDLEEDNEVDNDVDNEVVVDDEVVPEEPVERADAEADECDQLMPDARHPSFINTAPIIAPIIRRERDPSDSASSADDNVPDPTSPEPSELPDPSEAPDPSELPDDEAPNPLEAPSDAEIASDDGSPIDESIAAPPSESIAPASEAPDKAKNDAAEEDFAEDFEDFED